MKLADIFTNDKGFFQGGKSFGGRGFLQPILDGRGVIPWAQYEAEEAAKQSQPVQPKRLSEVPQLAQFGTNEGFDFKTGRKLNGPRQRLATREGLMNPNVQAQLMEQAQSVNIPAVGQVPGFSQQALDYARTGRRFI